MTEGVSVTYDGPVKYDRSPPFDHVPRIEPRDMWDHHVRTGIVLRTPRLDIASVVSFAQQEHHRYRAQFQHVLRSTVCTPSFDNKGILVYIEVIHRPEGAPATQVQQEVLAKAFFYDDE
jgi:hypothetical protein